MKIPSVEIRDTAQNRLVTCIEILSPVNKRDPGLTQYRCKRQQRYQSGIHLLEIDFIRRGQRPFAQPQLPPVAYAVALTRAKQPTTDIWALKLLDPLPVVPVPLNSPDPDAILDSPWHCRRFMLRRFIIYPLITAKNRHHHCYLRRNRRGCDRSSIFHLLSR